MKTWIILYRFMILKKTILWKKIYDNWKELEYICTYLPINTANAMLFSIISSKLSTNIFLALHISGACKRRERKLKTLGENQTTIKVTEDKIYTYTCIIRY